MHTLTHMHAHTHTHTNTHTHTLAHTHTHTHRCRVPPPAHRRAATRLPDVLGGSCGAAAPAVHEAARERSLHRCHLGAHSSGHVRGQPVTGVMPSYWAVWCPF